jgi:hypothetical protein
MDFDQMLETWRSQDAAPPYAMNHDALRQSLQTEDATVRRKRRRDMWIVCIGGGCIAVMGGFWVAIPIHNGWPAIYAVAAGVGCAIFVLYIGAFCLSRWRQAKSERNFGNTLHEEVKRSLSRVDIEISRFGNWIAATLQVAPMMVGAMLVSWTVRSSQGGSLYFFDGWWMYPWAGLVTIYLVRWSRRHAKEKLEPRRRRLRELLAALEARE